jgi:hypothetical protein
MPEATNGYTTIEISEAQSMVYDALQTASYRIGSNNYKHRGKKRYQATVEHAEIVEAMSKVLNGEITPEEAMSLLHQHDTLKQRLGE